MLLLHGYLEFRNCRPVAAQTLGCDWPLQSRTREVRRRSGRSQFCDALDAVESVELSSHRLLPCLPMLKEFRNRTYVKNLRSGDVAGKLGIVHVP
jgi:hypothetical protein